ncbi:hypothetical protein HDV00_002559 [Rhizophlyctis rosea]|nr:hypothetical protein HDV00_002559 [Rhizophlyctis rosea]
MAHNFYQKTHSEAEITPQTPSNNPPSSFLIHDVYPASANSFCESHLHASAAPLSTIAHHADVVVTMLPGPQHVKEVYLGEDGLLNSAKVGSVMIDSSTIDPATAREVARVAKERGVLMVDAPVSGGTGGAQAGTLTFMVGAPSQQDFDRVQPYLSHMGKNIVYCGANGNGQVAKICNNMLLGITMIAASETMNLVTRTIFSDIHQPVISDTHHEQGIRLGMDPKLLASILNSSSGRCWSTDTYNPCPGVMPNVPASRNYEGGFGVPLMAKDLGLAVAAAQEAKSTVLLGAHAHQIYNQLASSEEFGKKDFSSVFKWLNDDAKKFEE